MQALGRARPNHTESEATAVSRDGNTVVGFSLVPGQVDAFVWTAGAGMQILPSSGGGFAYGVNFDGTSIVGESDGRATIWRGGQAIDLGLVPGFGESAARSVNDNGTVVVGTNDVGLTTIASIWTPSQGMEPLADYLGRHGVGVPDGWTLRDCYAVSADGRTFVGTALPPSGYSQGFIATIPAPGAGVLAVVIAVGLGWRERRRSSWSRPSAAASS